MQNEKSGF